VRKHKALFRKHFWHRTTFTIIF